MKRLIFLGILIFSLGIGIAVLIGEPTFIRITYFQRYRLELFAKSEIKFAQILWKIVWERAKMFSWILLFSMTKWRRGVGWLCFMIGFLTAGILGGAYVICFQLKGILLFLGVLFPQIVFYVLALYFICQRKSGYGVLVCLLFLLGVLGETIIGTRLLRFLIKVLFL